MKKKALFFVVFVLFQAAPGAASGMDVSGLAGESASGTPAERPLEEGPGMWDRFKRRVGAVWRSDSFDLYVPVYAWHNRFMYDKSKSRRYNENSWGLGLGRSITDEDGDSHCLVIMGFQDSHNEFQPYGGYAFFKNYYFDEARDWTLGLGFSLGVTARHEYDYIPLPLPLPLASVQYKNFAAQFAYIPGGYNDGNVLFAWLRWHFE